MDSKVVFEGSKFFWKSRNTIDVWIIEHGFYEVFEIILYDPALNIEADRMYLSRNVLLKRLNPQEVDNQLSFAMRNSVALTETYLTGLNQRVIADYVLARLHLEQYSCQEHIFSMRWNFMASDVAWEQVEPLVVSRPVGLIAYAKEEANVRDYQQNNEVYPDLINCMC